jgi:hypothetical protein
VASFDFLDEIIRRLADKHWVPVGAELTAKLLSIGRKFQQRQLAL